jgi:diazepam-binding inhibitor (GABA receptor modulating acyl-CoA-binding protein)
MPSTAYEVAKVEVGLLLAAPSQNEMLELYGLAKIAEEVDIKSRPAPGMFDFAEKEKRKAWQKLLDEQVRPELQLLPAAQAQP